MIVDDIK